MHSFLWEDYKDKEPHPAVINVWKVRQLLLERTVGAKLASADAEKRNKCGPDTIPLVILCVRLYGSKKSMHL